eukprot:CAMPEP_0116951658 /NCGR_PEP_ID=MMETSP0467-20121206/40251_1 /TAXON_ID=283647 /ORGANISM="Mesodinium pulex, Strain SPMC105" /LENGTH=79 /DNA_ID=CAMNT_0004636747 /DNA_START=423 /DNA_END=659 /DNA_ORIENTATION=-
MEQVVSDAKSRIIPTKAPEKSKEIESMNVQKGQNIISKEEERRRQNKKGKLPRVNSSDELDYSINPVLLEWLHSKLATL